MIRGAQDAVRLFHEVYGLPVRRNPSLGTPEDRALRVSLIEEELAELKVALSDEDIVETADALTDLVYVVLGAFVTFGLNAEECLAEVQRSNMSKLGEDGLPIVREDGKILKGPDYSPPDLHSIVLG